MSAGGFVRRGFCPQGVLFRGLCPQGVLSAGGFVLDSSQLHRITISLVAFAYSPSKYMFKCAMMFCPQGVLFRGLCPQGALSAGGFVLDSSQLHRITISLVAFAYCPSKYMFKCAMMLALYCIQMTFNVSTNLLRDI